jgi:hypothetical protein
MMMGGGHVLVLLVLVASDGHVLVLLVLVAIT